MNREEFELLMADALGGELSSEDRAAFDAALAEHADWKQEYETAQHTLECLAELGAPRRVVARREGDALVIEPTAGTARAAAPRPMRGGWRYAAAVLIAFTAGYALHAAMILQEGVRPQETIVKNVTPQETGDVHATPTAGNTQSFEKALLSTHARKPSRSNLATCFIALATKR